MGDFSLQLTLSSPHPSLQGGYDSGRPGDGTVADLITFDPQEEEEMRIERSTSVDSYHMDPDRIERVKHPSSEQVCVFLLFFFQISSYHCSPV